MAFPLNQEIWRAVDGFVNYEISNHGRVRNAKRGKLLRQHLVDGYKIVVLSVNDKPKMKKIHRLIAEAFIDNPHGLKVVDHKNGNRTDNSILNLRWATVSENSQNKKKKSYTSSRYFGVAKARTKWQASICHNGKKHYLGRFEKEDDAAKAYNEKARELFGEFAKLNQL
jgi:hypothetical protein